jgi:hypothetical protein
MCDPDFQSSPAIVAEIEMADSPTVIDVPDPIELQQRSRLAVTVNAIRFMVDGEELTGKDRWTARGLQYQRRLRAQCLCKPGFGRSTSAGAFVKVIADFKGLELAGRTLGQVVALSPYCS